MSEETNKILGDLNTAFEEFKSTVNANEKNRDTLLEEKTGKLNDELTALQRKLEEVEKKAARPAAADESAEADAEYRSAFGDYVRKGRITADFETRAMAGSTNSGADGGYAIPSVIDAAVSEKLVQVSPLRQVAKVISVSTPNFTHLVNLRGTASGWVADTAARTETASPSLLSVAIPMGDLYANPSATQQILDDANFDVEGFLADNIATEFARAEGAAFLTGNGTNKPSGLLAAAPTSAGSDTVIQYVANGDAALLNSSDNLLKLVYTLKSPYRANASWLMNANTMSVIRQMKDSQGRYQWQPGLAAGQPSTFLGYNVVECPDMADIAANALPIAFGDFSSAYLIVDRKGIQTIRDPYTNKPYIMFYTVKRVGGKLVLPEAVKVAKIAVS